jgi:hypothetical protein
MNLPYRFLLFGEQFYIKYNKKFPKTQLILGNVDFIILEIERKFDEVSVILKGAQATEESHEGSDLQGILRYAQDDVGVGYARLTAKGRKTAFCFLSSPFFAGLCPAPHEGRSPSRHPERGDNLCKPSKPAGGVPTDEAIRGTVLRR